VHRCLLHTSPHDPCIPAERDACIRRCLKNVKANSSYDYFAKVESPNGLYEAVFDNAGEICMGGPAVGTLTITEKTTGRRIACAQDANGAFIWASDSSAIAYPKWNSRRYQNLAIIRIPEGSHEISDDVFRVLELESFESGLVEGVDSPIHNPRRVSYTVLQKIKT
jgi:hypothetical protein